ncbi:key lime pathogenicity protein [Purpureocillium lavendulum]|uniref:Key lime pathogenicity protein n=1 Tax=Purpureocillium lavendulum TaxID=1247861 RepID=A0AB34FPU6_9HYPO|nr:key lime pathogenicity protein [Purpureocillium lavendulum]
MDPGLYLASSSWGDDDMSYLASTGANLSPHDIYDSFNEASGCPSMISAPSVSEPSQPLTRQNSSFDVTARGSTMMRLISSQSRQGEDLYSQESMTSFAPGNSLDQGTKGTTRDRDFFAMGAGFPTSTQSYPSTTPLAKANLFPSADTTSMERSTSNTSVTSTKSTSSNLERRCKEAFQRVRQNSNRNIIAPKPQKESGNGRAPASSVPSKKDGKVALQKTPYQRPKHPKVYCDQCTEHPDGFRGDHELRRHLNAKHKGIVKKFVCRDPASVGLNSTVQVLYPLADCRACNSKKQYGAYYNAAAHLRRTHFKPKAPRGKNKSASDEKRGGKGGGDWPAMSDLKLWYEEVYVASDGSGTPDDAADEIEEDALDTEDTSMGGYGGLDDGEPFSTDAVYGISLPGTVDTQYEDSNGAMSVPAGMASASQMGFLPYGSLYAGDGTTSEYAASHSPFGSGVSPVTAVTSAYYDSSAPGMADYMWQMDDV